MSLLRRLGELGALWLGLIGFILVMGIFLGLKRGLGPQLWDDLGPLIAGAFFIGTMVLILMGVFKLVGWFGRIFRRG